MAMNDTNGVNETKRKTENHKSDGSGEENRFITRLGEQFDMKMTCFANNSNDHSNHNTVCSLMCRTQ